MSDTNLPVRRHLPVPLLAYPPPRPPRRRTGAVWGLLCGLALALALGLGLLLINRHGAGATPMLHTARVIVAEPSVSTPLPIQLGPPEAVPPQGWIRIMGLPPLASLSDGHAIAPGSWRVPVGRLLGLEITAPPGQGTGSSVNIALVAPHGGVLAEAQSTLVVASLSRLLPGGGHTPANKSSGFEATCPEVAASQQPSARLEPPHTLSEQERRWRAEILVHAGDKRLADGNIAAARAFYKRAAELGFSAAAVALGATYDPDEAQRVPLLGVGADPQKASCWYAKARQLADMEVASQRRN